MNTLPYTYFDFKVYFTVLMFIFSNLLIIFFGHFWSQDLKLFKLTEIWYRDRLLYVYFNFDVYFSKFFVSQIFGGKFGSII